MLRVKSVETAFQAVPNQYVQGAIDALGIFDNVIQPVFPYPFSNIALIFLSKKWINLRFLKFELMLRMIL